MEARASTSTNSTFSSGSGTMLNLIWWIPALPLLGVAINGLFGKRMSLRAVGTIACAVIALSFVLSLGAFVELRGLEEGARYHEVTVGTWMELEGLSIDWGFALDPLSAVMILMVTGVGFLIHGYSVG